ncbi:TRAP transporter permease [Stella sp.]|uniref:TRAP transporter permease n=1 Tax=Stella sp. TaxID=2912054 RepID=UPI0035AD94B2
MAATDVVAGGPMDREGGSGLVTRGQSGPLRLAIHAVAILVALAHIYLNVLATPSELHLSAFHFASFGLLCALVYPAWHARSAAGRRLVLALDIVLGLIAVGCFLYLVLGETAFYARGSSFETIDWMMTAAAALLAVEFTRRTTGMTIPIIIIVFFTYVTVWGKYVPGMLTFPGLSFETMLFRGFYTDDGMLGNVAQIGARDIVMFILFGAFLMRSGAGDFIIDFARAVAGRLAGGPGFVAVIGSALFGTISGSAVANVVSTGVVTIPLMKRAGYSPRFSGAVEATASTGGQIMPPVMGAGAFVMASYLQIDYLYIAAVSVLPAILYFLSVGFYVRIEAKKHGLTLADENPPALLAVLRDGAISFFAPIAVLVGMLVSGYSPPYAAGFGIVAVVVASWLSPKKIGPAGILDALATGSKNMILTAVLLVAIGIVINAVTTTGLGNTFSLMINQWAGNNLLIALILIAIASLVLGMGLPVTAAYIVLATLSAPALADLILRQDLVAAIASGQIADSVKAVLMLVAPDQMAAIGQPMDSATAAALLDRVPAEMKRMVVDHTVAPQAVAAALLAAHLIIFWLSQDSNVTPPVCLAAFAAAAIAKGPPMGTGFTAWRLAKGLYIVPLLFAYTPFIGNSFWIDLELSIYCAFALYAFAVAWEGHGEAPVSWPVRIVLAGCFLALLWPNERLLHLAGVAVMIPLVVWNIRADRRAARPA